MSSSSICPGADLLLLLQHDLLEEPAAAAELRAHLDRCAACVGRAGALEAALSPPPAPAPPPEVLRALEARIAAEAVAIAEQQAPARARVGLRCTYCHDDLAVARAVYCADCLAPQHEECFAAHGSCAAPGCGSRGLLRRREAPPAPRRLRPRERLLLGALAASVLGYAAFGPPPPEPPPSPLRPREDRRVRAMEALADLPGLGLDARLRQCEAALALDPECVPALLARAELRWALARRDPLALLANASSLLRPALEDAAQAVVLEPGSAEARLIQGRLLLAMRDPTAARAALREAGARDPQGGVGRLAAGWIAELDASWAAAEAAFREALEQDPTLVQGWLGRARARLRRRDFVGGLSDAQEALRRDPYQAEAYSLLARSRWEASGDAGGDVLRDLEQALRLDPCAADALALRARLRLERDARGRITASTTELGLAELDAQLALRLVPDHPLAELVLREIAAVRNTRALALPDPSSSAFPWLLRGRLEPGAPDDSGDFDALLRATDGERGLDALRARAHAGEAARLFRRRSVREARAEVDAALELDPDLPEALFLRGLCHLQAWRDSAASPVELRAALHDFSRATTLAPGLADARFYRAITLMDCGELEAAVVDLAELQGVGAEQAVFFRRDQVLYFQGVAELRLEHREEARRLLRSYLEQAVVGDECAMLARQALRELDAEPLPAPSEER